MTISVSALTFPWDRYLSIWAQQFTRCLPLLENAQLQPSMHFEQQSLRWLQTVR